MKHEDGRWMRSLTRNLPVRTSIIAVGICSVLSAEASAQELQVGVGRSWVDHDLLGAPVGVHVILGLPVTANVDLSLGYERHRDEFETFGTTCTGLVSPEADCEGELRQDQARMVALSLSAAISLFQRGRLSGRLVPGVRVGSVSSSQTGQRTGQMRSAEKTTFGFQVAGELRAALHPSHPLSGILRGSVGSLRGWNEQIVADGYTPFEGPMRFIRLEAGLAVRP